MANILAEIPPIFMKMRNFDVIENCFYASEMVRVSFLNPRELDTTGPPRWP